MAKNKISPFRAICLMGFSCTAAFSAISPVFSIFIKETTNASVEIVGLVTAVFFVAGLTSRFLLGVYGGGRKTITYLLFAYTIFVLTNLFYPFSSDTMTIIALRTIQGFTFASITVSAFTFAGITTQFSDKNKAIAVYTTWLGFGFLFGPTINLAALPFLGVTNMFFIATLISIVGWIAAFAFYRKFSEINDKWRIVGYNLKREPAFTRVKEVIRNRLFQFVLLANFVFFFLFGVLLTYSPLYMNDMLGFNNEMVSLSFLLYYLTMILTRFFIRKLPKRLGKNSAILLCIALIIPISVLMTFATEGFIFVLLFVLVGAVQGILFPIASTLLADAIPANRIVLANSLYFIGFDLGQATAPLVVASIISLYGIPFGFAFAGILATVFLPFLYLIVYHKKSSMIKE